MGWDGPSYQKKKKGHSLSDDILLSWQKRVSRASIFFLFDCSDDVTKLSAVMPLHCRKSPRHFCNNWGVFVHLRSNDNSVSSLGFAVKYCDLALMMRGAESDVTRF